MKSKGHSKKILSLGLFLTIIGVCSMLTSGTAHAATINVSGSCPIEDAITSLNSTADENTCTHTGNFGTNDTINIPAGTYTLTTDLPVLTVTANITGAGMGQTIIDGDSNYTGLALNGVDAVVSGITITAYRTYALSAENVNLNLSNFEADGTGSVNAFRNVFINNTNNANFAVNSNNVYIHDVDISTTIVFGFIVQQMSGGTTTADISNTTIANLNNSGGGIDAFLLGVGVVTNTPGDFGTINASIVNTTIDNLSSTNITAPFAGVGFANNGDTDINLDVYNVTITGTRGVTGGFLSVTDVKTAAFYAAGSGIGNVVQTYADFC